MHRLSGTVIAALISLLGTAARAEAAVPHLLRAGTKPLWASVSPGPSIGALDSITQLKLVEEVGYHFGGSASGLAIAFNLQQAYGADTVLFETGPKLVYDFQVHRSLGLYISPSLLLGYAHQSSKYSDSEHGVTAQFACEAKLTLADRAFLFFRPVGVDVLHLRWRGMGHTGVRYELLFGGGAVY